MSENQEGLPQGWVLTTIGEVVSPFVEQRAPEDNKEFTYVEISSIDNSRKSIVSPTILPGSQAPTRARQRLKAGDVLVSLTRPNLNAVALVPPRLEGVVGSTGFDVLRPLLVNPRWIFYAVQHPDFIAEMSRRVLGVVYPAIRPKDVRSYPLPLPPLEEQERVVGEIEKQLTRLDTAVKALERLKANLTRYRASVLKAACEGRLVPTEADLARAEGRGFNTAQSYLGQKESSDQDADLPPLPEGWLWTRLSNIGQVTGGLTKNPARSGYSLKLPYLRVANVYAGRLELDDVQQIGIQENEVERGLLRRDDLLIVEGNGSIDQIGRVAIWDGSISPCVHQNHIIKVRFPKSELARYAFLWLLSPEGRSQIVRVASSTTGLHTLSISKVGNLLIPLPPPEELSRIIAETERQISIIERLEQTCSDELVQAQNLRQAILRQAFSARLVPQDSSDESATALLERIREARGTTNEGRDGTSQARSRRSRPEPAFPSGESAETELDSDRTPFIEHDPSEQLKLAWKILFGRGLFEKEDAIRAVAERLRLQGLAHFQRLRKHGPLFNDIASAIDRGVRQGFFDRPKRGHVRAILADPQAYSPVDWRLCLLGALDGEPVEEEDALRAAADWARENMGLEFARLREDGVILKGLRAALKEAVGRGEVEKVGRRQIRKAG